MLIFIASVCFPLSFSSPDYSISEFQFGALNIEISSGISTVQCGLKMLAPLADYVCMEIAVRSHCSVQLTVSVRCSSKDEHVVTKTECD